jgi:hypothetical protein
VWPELISVWLLFSYFIGASQTVYRNLIYIKSPLSKEICLLFGQAAKILPDINEHMQYIKGTKMFVVTVTDNLD